MIYSILAQLALLLLSATFAAAGNPSHSEYRVLPAVTNGNLSIFPVVGGPEYSTAPLLTLDEGLRNGTVVVTEAGSLQGLVRRGTRTPRQSGDEVNRLVLINNSDHPLLLLAGEVVTGGKQDRVIGVDRIVPPKSDPIDLSVFCVEPGRWVASSRPLWRDEVADGAAQRAHARHGGARSATVWANVADCGWRNGIGRSTSCSGDSRHHLIRQSHGESGGREEGRLRGCRLRQHVA